MINNVNCLYSEHRTCKDWKREGLTGTSIQIIDPDGPSGEAPFPVTCDFDKTPVQSIVHHDKEGPVFLQDTTHPNGCLFISTEVVITYSSASYAQVAALVDEPSTTCKEAVKVECVNVDIDCQGLKDRTGTYEILSYESWKSKTTICTTSKSIFVAYPRCQKFMYNKTMCGEKKNNNKKKSIFVHYLGITTENQSR